MCVRVPHEYIVPWRSKEGIRFHGIGDMSLIFLIHFGHMFRSLYTLVKVFKTHPIWSPDLQFEKLRSGLEKYPSS